MKSIRVYAVLLGIVLALPRIAEGQNQSRHFAVQVQAEILEEQNSLRLYWPASGDSITQYRVLSKERDAVSWLNEVARFDSATREVIIDNQTRGTAREYLIEKRFAGNNTAYGFIYAGVEIPAIEARGSLLLLVDSLNHTALQAEIGRYVRDCIGDGWQVVLRAVARDAGPKDVRAIIVEEYNKAPEQLKAVLLMGAIPVPYSGNIAPDAHQNHIGAWPADVYYGDVNGNWTDTFINNDSTANRPENRNTIGDGKFDQSLLPSDLELQVGRIDFSNMPIFPQGETALLRRYLDRNHAYRHKHFSVPQRGVIRDQFGAFNGEAFAAGAWRNYAVMFGTENSVEAANYIESLKTESYLWSYGCGPGSYTGAGGVGATDQFLNGHFKHVFAMLFGSYFGDWAAQNNFLRAALAADGYCLTGVWSGRPHWQFHHMALGETIGYSAWRTQNNSNTYYAGYGARQVHVALLGDPTLRLHVVEPPGALNLGDEDGHAVVRWSAPQEAVLGYYIYRADSLHGRFRRITDEMLSDTRFTDSEVLHGEYTYMVRAVQLQNSASGSYYNLSQGLIGNIELVAPLATSAPPAEEFCSGERFDIGFISRTALGPEITVEAQLSDNTGSFEDARTIGSAPGNAAAVAVTIPQDAVEGYGYRIRVVNTTQGIEGVAARSIISIVAASEADFSPVVSERSVRFQNTSRNSSTYNWDFGDGNQSAEETPRHTYATYGSYTVRLIASGQCGHDTLERIITLNPTSVWGELEEGPNVHCYPNPASGFVNISIDYEQALAYTVNLLDITGHLVRSRPVQHAGGKHTIVYSLEGLAVGVYWLELQTPVGALRRLLVKE